MIRILLVDDRNLFQQGIKSLLARDPEIKVVGTAKDGRTAIIQIEELRPDIVLLDIEMPEMDGITATKYITYLTPQTKVIILSSHEDKKYLTQALMAGAKAYVLKNSLMTDLKQSIIAVNNGYSHIESRLLAKIFDPSNLKLNSRKKTLQNSQSAKVATHEPRSKTSATRVDSDARTIQSNTITRSNDINRKTVPKIDLPYLNLDSVDDFVIERDLLTALDAGSIETPKLLPPAEVHDSASRLPVKLDRLNSRDISAIDGSDSRHTARLSSAKYKTELTRLWTAKTLQYRPFIERTREQLAGYQTKIMPLLKQWHEKGWLANIGLVILGLVTTIIIHLMFA